MSKSLSPMATPMQNMGNASDRERIFMSILKKPMQKRKKTWELVMDTLYCCTNTAVVHAVFRYQSTYVVEAR